MCCSRWGTFIDSEVTVHISNLLCVLELIYVLAGSDLLLTISLFVGQCLLEVHANDLRTSTTDPQLVIYKATKYCESKSIS